MNNALSRVLLLFLLLALNGQAFAAPCASVRDDNSHHQSAPPAAGDHCAAAKTAHHCEPADVSQTDACEQACSCCPGHCASAIPASESGGTASPPVPARANYTEFHSSALPEATLRPPISA